MTIAPDGERKLTIRTLTEADLPEFSQLLASAFLVDHTDEQLANEGTVYEPDRSHGVFDGSVMIGCGEVLTRGMTVPGAGTVPVGAVTAVGVAPGHRRRGALSMIMRAQLAGMHADGEPIAILWASEGSIYGRFGYGLATQYTRYVVPKGAAFRSGVELDADPVREVPRERAFPLMRELYPVVAGNRVGSLQRTEANWEFHFSDKEFNRKGMSTLRFAVHPHAYAAYRVKLDWQDRGPRSALVVHELIATNPSAYATMCRYLLDVDLVGEVTLRQPTDEPLQHLLANPRVALRSMVEGVWVRLVDVDRALAARRYTVPLDVVLDITDPVCPWNAGRWRLVAGTDGDAEVTRTNAAPDLALGIDDLGAVFLGGTRLTALAAAGRVREARPGVAARAALAFVHDHEPACVELF